MELLVITVLFCVVLPSRTPSLQTFATEPSFSNNSCIVDILKTDRYYCNQDGSSFRSSKLGMVRGIWNRTVLYDPQNQRQLVPFYIYPKYKPEYSERLAVFCCHQILPASLNTDQQKNTYKCVQNMTTIDVCWSLNRTYSNGLSMGHGLAPSSTKRESKRTSCYRKSSILVILIFTSSMTLLMP